MERREPTGNYFLIPKLCLVFGKIGFGSDWAVDRPNQLVTRTHTRDVQTTMKWEEMEEETKWLVLQV